MTFYDTCPSDNGFPDRLREARRKRGYSARQLAYETGMHDASVSGYLQGKNYPSAQCCMAIAATLGVSLDWLLMGKKG